MLYRLVFCLPLLLSPGVSRYQMALIDLYLQGAQCVITSKDLFLAEWASVGGDTGPLTNIGRQMVRLCPYNIYSNVDPKHCRCGIFLFVLPFAP